MICIFCSIDFKPKNNKQKFCTQKCYFDSLKGFCRINSLNKRGIKPKTQKQCNCSVCNTNFYVSNYRDAKYCSRECWKNRNPPVAINCNFCQNKFTDYLSNNRKFCTKECFDNFILQNPRKISQETRNKKSQALKGKIPKNLKQLHISNIGSKKTEETKQKIREKRLNQLPVPRGNTGIEIKIQNLLLKKNIKFVPHYNLGNRFEIDLFIPESNLAIECDGDYWHSLPASIERDKKKNLYCESIGLSLLRLSEKEINKDIHNCWIKIENLL